MLLQDDIHNYWGGAMAKMQKEGRKRRGEEKHVRKDKKLGDVCEEVKDALESNMLNNSTKTDAEYLDDLSI